MRMWEFDENRGLPTSLVLEQDFILRIRRLHRLGKAHIVANIALSAIPADYAGRGTIEDAQRRIQALLPAQNGTYAEMSNGDVFLTWAQSPMAAAFPQQALMVALPDGVQPQDLEKYVRVYNVPQDYVLLRERANDYVNELRTSSPNDEDNAPKLLQSESTRGPLTAWSLSLIERLAKDIDLAPYIRTQSVYEIQKDKGWKQLFDETYVGLDDVKQKHFPHIDVTHPKHLFLELCQVFDRNLLENLMANFDTVNNSTLNLNLSLPTVLSTGFAQFTHLVPRGNRSKIGFEIHCGDLLQDFTQTLGAIATIRQEGYRVGIDGVTPDMLAYFNLLRFDVDHIKIDASKDYASTFKQAAIRESLVQTAREKLIFCHCDNEQSLAAGLELGITKFQGFLIDEKAKNTVK